MARRMLASPFSSTCRHVRHDDFAPVAAHELVQLAGAAGVRGHLRLDVRDIGVGTSRRIRRATQQRAELRLVKHVRFREQKIIDDYALPR